MTEIAFPLFLEQYYKQDHRQSFVPSTISTMAPSSTTASSSGGGLKASNMALLVLGAFSLFLVGTNLFYLPSLGFLKGPSQSSQSQHHIALKEFTRTTSGTMIRKKKPTIINDADEDSKDENDDNKNLAVPENPQNQVLPDNPEDTTDDGLKDENDPPPPPFQNEKAQTQHPKIAGLNCDRFGGPSEAIAAEMVYWRDIPNDAAFVSPYKHPNKKQYLTFEPDEGGFNNIRMSMETATALAHAMGRILVLPPEQDMYLLGKDHRQENNRFTFHKFFPFEAISEEHDAVDVISMEEFIRTEALEGNLNDKTGQVSFPPNNSTNFDGGLHKGREYWDWLRTVTMASKADFSKCVIAFPEKPGAQAREQLETLVGGMDMNQQSHGVPMQYRNRPRPVDSAPIERLHEQLAFRKQICMYDETLQNTKVMHFMGDNNSGARLLVHFYAFLFFEDWQQDLWTKRYVRDHLRYIDAIQCGAASIVHAVRQQAIQNGNPNGEYDSMHIRRGDFQYKQTRIPATEILENIRDKIADNSTVFIATDERDKTFFDPLRKHYHLLFLDDFLHLLPDDFNKNYYGMLDQRVASRGRIFFGAYLSTFTGYINRMRGYHTQKEHSEGYLDGNLKSYFYVPKQNRDDMETYRSLTGPLWGREFPTAWRDIDHNVHETHIVGR